jgi:hypothetical protein
MKAFQIATAMRVRCDCDARANPRNEHCIIYESVSNCDCAAMKIAALAHRSRNWKLSFNVSQRFEQLLLFEISVQMRRHRRVWPVVANKSELFDSISVLSAQNSGL